MVRIVGQPPAHDAVGVLEDSQDDPAGLDLFPAFILDQKMTCYVAVEILLGPALLADLVKPRTKASGPGIQLDRLFPVGLRGIQIVLAVIDLAEKLIGGCFFRIELNGLRKLTLRGSVVPQLKIRYAEAEMRVWIRSIVSERLSEEVSGRR